MSTQSYSTNQQKDQKNQKREFLKSLRKTEIKSSDGKSIPQKKEDKK